MDGSPLRLVRGEDRERRARFVCEGEHLNARRSRAVKLLALHMKKGPVIRPLVDIGCSLVLCIRL